MKNQEKVWNNISKFWAKYRVHSPRQIQDFLNKQQNNILDLGCGSGRNFPIKQINNQIIYGVDFSESMLFFAEELIKKRKLNALLFKANSKKLPFKSNFFNAAICISLLNTIPKKQDQLKTIKEIYRVLKPDSELLISTWNKNSEKINHLNKRGFFKWSSDNNSFLRFSYFYTKEELVYELKSFGFKILEILDSKENKFTRKNIIIYCKK